MSSLQRTATACEASEPKIPQRTAMPGVAVELFLAAVAAATQVLAADAAVVTTPAGSDAKKIVCSFFNYLYLFLFFSHLPIR